MHRSGSAKKVISNSLVYTVSGLLIKCFNFFLLPLYTAYLSTSDYGITSIAASFLSTMGFIASFSLFSAVMRFYVDLKEDEHRLKRFYGTITVFVLLSGLVLWGLLIALHKPLSEYVFSGVDFFPVIFLCLCTMVFNCQYQIYENILKSQQKAVKCSILSICYFLLMIACTILFVVVLKKGATGVLLATLVANTAYTLFFWSDMLISKSMIICLDKDLLKEALKYSIPIMPHNLSPHIAELFSKSLLGAVISLASVGVFSVAAQFGTIADTIQIYVNNAYGPWLYEQLYAKDDGYKQSIRSVVKLLTAAIGFFFIGISLFSQDYILLFVNKSYADAWHYVPLIVGMYTIKTTYWFYINILFYFKKASKILFTATLTGSLINVLLSYFLIPLWGVYGSILADIIAMLIRVIIVVIISRNYEDIGLKLSDFISNAGIVALFIALGLSLSFIKYENNFSLINFAFKVGVILVYVLVQLIIYRKQIRRLHLRYKQKKLSQ